MPQPPVALYGVYDYYDSTALQSGDLVQLLWAGPNGQIDKPAADGTPGGDDELLDINVVENGTPLPSPFWNKGYVPLKTYTLDSRKASNGGIVYLRAWNGAAAGAHVGYGNSVTGILAGGATFSAPRWHTDRGRSRVYLPLLLNP